MKISMKNTAIMGISLILILLTTQANDSAITVSLEDVSSHNGLITEDTWYHWNSDQNHNKLDDILDEKILNHSDELVNIYINYYSKPTQMDVKKLKDHGINISYQAKYINTICAREVPMDKVTAISRWPNIARIELQPFIIPALDVSAASIKARDSVEYSPETAWELGYTGRDTVIAILDSGIDDRHESLENKRVAGYDCTLLVPRETDPDDEDGHGTHVAGIALGTGGDEGKYRGIAPNAKLVDVKVLNDWTLTPGDQVVMGIEWCMDQKDTYNIDILSMSIGEVFTGDDNGQGTQAQLVDAAANSGLVVVVAAGNDGEQGFSSLAAAEGAITVGAIDEKGSVNRSDDSIWDFSNHGPRADDGDDDEVDEYKPDVVAPGVSIMSARFSNTPAGILTGYQALTGTSMACPHVAGLVALMLEANPNLTPNQVKQILHDTSEARGHPYHSKNDPKYNIDYGWGIVNAYEAVRKTLGGEYQDIEVLSHGMNEEVHNIISIYGTAGVSKGNIQAIEYKIDLGVWQEALGQEDWQFQWDSTTVQNGVHSIFIRSFDGIEYSTPFELILNVVNIGCEIIKPQNGSQVKNNIVIQGTSFGAGVSEVFIQIGDDTWILVEAGESGNYSTWKYNWDTKSVKNGNHILSVKAYNGEWESIPTSMEVTVKNSRSSGGFLSGFDWLLVLTSFIILIIITYITRSRIKNR